MKYTKLVGVILVFCNTLPLAAQNPKEQNSDLAKVALLPFHDNTGSKNFAYLPKSLHEAIDASLRTKFEYIPIDHKTAETAAKAANTQKHKNADQYDDNVLKTVKGDILISGDFTYDQKENLLLIRTRIRVLDLKETLILPELKNKVDDTIFDATDKVATLVVIELTKLAQRNATAAKGPDKKPTEEKEKPKEKIALKREIPPDFATTQHTISINLGRGFTFGHEYLSMIGALSLDYRYLLKKQWFVAGELRAVAYNPTEEFQQKNNAGYILNLVSLAVEGGFYYNLSPRLRLPLSVIAGYYWGTFGIDSENNFSYRRSIRNPAWGATAGAEYLLLRNISAGLRLATYFYIDQNRSGENNLLTSVDPQVTIAYVF